MLLSVLVKAILGLSYEIKRAEAASLFFVVVSHGFLCLLSIFSVHPF